MSARLPLRFGLGLLLLATIVSASGRDKNLDWLERAATTPVRVATAGADWVVLLDEARLEVARDGMITTRTRYVIRILTADGRKQAVARVPYLQGSDKITSFRAWLRRADGTVLEVNRREMLDVAAFTSGLELYGENRMQVLAAPVGHAATGDVFAYESVVQERSVFAQRIWQFQSLAPVERSTCTITVPAGWTVDHRIFNHPPIEVVRAANSFSWTLEQLPAPEMEPFSPPPSAIYPWLAVDLRPPANERSRIRQMGGMDWSELAQHFSPAYETAAKPTPAMQARADALVKSAESDWEKAAFLARFVQQVNYISINLNAGRAGGFFPRSAADVFRLNYGDCKDKTTLLRAMLRTQGIESFPLIVFSGDAEHVREEWPSPLQFNHCILAIRVEPDSPVPAMIEHPTLGRLVIFDPTDSVTPFGLIQVDQLAALSLILAGPQGGLVRLPVTEAAPGRLVRTVHARLDASGTMVGLIEEHFSGLAANPVRAEFRDTAPSAYHQTIERWLGRSMPSPRALRVAPVEDTREGTYRLEVDFQTIGYGRPMRDVLLVFKPMLVARRQHPVLRTAERRHPLLLAQHSFVETTTIELPDGFRVDELPSPVDLQHDWGRYRAEVRLEGHSLRVERQLELRRQRLPADQAATVKAFFDAVVRAEQSPVVLERQKQPATM
jgi:hypothetical protein